MKALILLFLRLCLSLDIFVGDSDCMNTDKCDGSKASPFPLLGLAFEFTRKLHENDLIGAYNIFLKSDTTLLFLIQQISIK